MLNPLAPSHPCSLPNPSHLPPPNSQSPNYPTDFATLNYSHFSKLHQIMLIVTDPIQKFQGFRLNQALDHLVRLITE